MTPKISIIVPVYNVAPYVERCVRSLMEQTLDDLEYIFVDDASPDNSVAIIEKTIKDYPQRVQSVQIIHHEHNRGLTAARNSGLEIAHGEFVAHCDSDDYVDVTMYEKLYNKTKETGAEIAMCDFFFAYPNKLVRYNTIRPGQNHIQTVNNYLIIGWPNLWNFIAKKSIYDNNNLKSPEGITYSEDFFLGVRLLFLAQDISFVEEPLYFYNQSNGSSIMKNLGPDSVLEERNCYYQTIEFFKEHNVLSEMEEAISWRVLKNKQRLVLSPETFDEFLSIFPTSHRHIASCPEYFCQKKFKIQMWLVAHKMRWIAKLLLNIRTAIG